MQFMATDPKTRELDDKIEQMMDAIVVNERNSGMKKVTSTGYFGFFDKDFSKLQKLRKAYLFAESAYDALSKDVKSTLKRDFKHLVKERDGLLNLSEAEVNEFERLVNYWEISYNRQLLYIDRLTGLYKMKYLKQEFDNQDKPVNRKKTYVESWEKTQGEKFNQAAREIKDIISYMRKNIQTYQESKDPEHALSIKPKPIVTTRVEQKVSLHPGNEVSTEADLAKRDNKSLTKL
jgi:hypothetical protein